MSEYEPPEQAWGIEAARIRAAVPIKGKTATERECRERNELEAAFLEGTPSEGRGWYTGRLSSGRVVGQWAESRAEAAVGIMIWFGEQLEWITRDADCTIHNHFKKIDKEAEKGARAVARKIERTEAKYTDTTTTRALLEATVQEGMLF